MGNLESAEGGPGEPPSVALLPPPGKTPMPEPCELEERFALVLVRANPSPPRVGLARDPHPPVGSPLPCTVQSAPGLRCPPLSPPGTSAQPPAGSDSSARGPPAALLGSLVWGMQRPGPGPLLGLGGVRRPGSPETAGGAS